MLTFEQTHTNIPIIGTVWTAKSRLYITFNEPFKPRVILERELALFGTIEIGAACIKVPQDDPILVATKVGDSLVIDSHQCIEFTVYVGIVGMYVYSHQEKLRDS